MATININENETINVELREQSSSLNTTLKDINYIPSYKEAETERRTNETSRIANENNREEYINDFKDRVSKGEFNGKNGTDGKDGAIQYTAGEGIEIKKNVISATGGKGTWGSITGTLSDQTDLKTALDNKANTSDIPTKVSDLTNDSEFITKTVDNLTNYYKKSEIYTQEQVNTLISNVNSFNVEVVQTLPTENIDTHTIYLVPKEAETNDNYDEYIYINNSWEHIGSTNVDLTNYYNKNEIDTKLEEKQNALVSAENIKTINNNSILGSGNIDVSGSPTGDTLPIGSIIPFGSKAAPTNWLSCNGQAVSRTTYADLFAVIGTQFGEGDGSTTFNLPDINQYRMPIGYDRLEEQSNRKNLGTIGGEEKHTMTIDELVPHPHTYPRTWGGSSTADVDGKTQAGYGDASYWSDGNTSTTGGGQPFNVMQPYVTTNYIIKAFQSSGLVANVAQAKTTSDNDTYSCNYINELEEKRNEKLLWTNPDMSVEFGEQTLNFDDNYSYFDIIFSQDNVNYFCTRVYAGLDKPYLLQNILGGYFRTRGVIVNQNSIFFGGGTFFATYSNATANNSQCIPYKIVGYK